MWWEPWTPVIGTDILHPRGSQRRMFLQDTTPQRDREKLPQSGESHIVRSLHPWFLCEHGAFEVCISSQPGDTSEPALSHPA